MPRIPTQELLRLAKLLVARLGGETGVEAERLPTLLESLKVFPQSRLASRPSAPPLLVPEVFEPQAPTLTTRIPHPEPRRIPEQEVPFMTGTTRRGAYTDMPQLADVPEPPLGEITEGPIFDAAVAMQRVIDKTISRFPAVVGDKFAPRPKVTDWLAGKPGAALPADKLLNRQDLEMRLARMALKESSRNPNRSINDLTDLLGDRLARWVQRSTARLSEEPYGAAQRRRLIKKSGTLTGRDPDSAEVGAAKAWLEKHKLIEPPQIVSTTQTVRRMGGELEEEIPELATALRPDQVLEQKMAGEGAFDVNVPKVRKALDILARTISDPKVLTERQRAAVNLRLGLEGGNGLSVTDVAKSMGISQPGATQLIQGGLKKLRAALEKAGVNFEKAVEPGFPEGDPGVWPHGEKALLTLLRGEPRFPAGYHSRGVQGPPVARTSVEGISGRRILEQEGYVPRMAEEVRPGAPPTSSVTRDIVGSLVPRVRSYTEPVPAPKRGSSTAGQIFGERPLFPEYTPEWVKKDAENERIAAQLLSLLKTSKGKPLVSPKELVAPPARKWVTEPLIATESRGPSQLRLPTKPPLKRRVVKPEEEVAKGFRTSKPVKLVPDPNGTIFIGEDSYRLVELVPKQVVNPKNKREIITIYVEKGT